MSTARLVMAVDGGGTKTTACIARRNGAESPQIVGCATSGRSNPAVVGIDEAKEQLQLAMDSALRAAELPPDESCDRVVIGLAGLEATDAKEPLRSWAAAHMACSTTAVITDIELLLLALPEDQPAVALVSGTGSVAIARDQTGHIARSGGRGYLVGDEGSGFWIGMMGLRAALGAMDGHAPATALVEMLAEHIGVPDAAGWTKHIYGAAGPRAEIASCARIVLAAAERNDPVASAIADQAAHELSKLVQSVSGQLSLKARAYNLALVGGVLTNSPLIRDRLTAALEALHLVPRDSCAIPEPAAAVCRQIA